MSRNVFSINQGTNEDDSQSNPHPEAGLLTYGRENRHDMATGVQGESVDACDINAIVVRVDENIFKSFVTSQTASFLVILYIVNFDEKFVLAQLLEKDEKDQMFSVPFSMVS